MLTTTRIPLRRPKIDWGNENVVGHKGDLSSRLIKSYSTNYTNFRIFAESIHRPFGVRYNPYTQSVEVLSSAKRITAAVSELRGDLSIVSSALRKISALDHDLDVNKITQLLQTGLQVSHWFHSRIHIFYSLRVDLTVFWNKYYFHRSLIGAQPAQTTLTAREKLNQCEKKITLTNELFKISSYQ